MIKIYAVLCLISTVFTVSSCRVNNSKDTQRYEAPSKCIGIDVSHHQGTIDWKAVADSKIIVFAYIKATEGATYTDNSFKDNIKNAKENGLLVGAYHFFRMTSSPEAQFRNFKNALSIIECDLIPMVDVETSDGKTKAEVQKNLHILLDMLEKEYGKKPMIYGTNRSYNSLCYPEFNSYPLYIGRYGSEPPIIRGTDYTVWQYTETGVIKGIPKNVDLCRFHMNASIKDIIL